MLVRLSWIVVLLLGLGHPLSAQTLPSHPTPEALQLWRTGQEALRDGQTQRAIECFEQSLAADSTFTRNYLSLAAAYLEKGEEERACLHLTLYVAAHPEHLAVRIQYAELLHRLQHLPQARDQFERFIAEAQEAEQVPDQIIHSHSRLMQIAETRQDEYEEHLHRGIGLYLLAMQRVGLPDAREGENSTPSLLCRAAAELTLAKRNRPDEARPWWYLYEVWTNLLQQQPAATALRTAEEKASFSYLTPAEKRALYLAVRQRTDTPRK